jgi:hypothetical protein
LAGITKGIITDCLEFLVSHFAIPSEKYLGGAGKKWFAFSKMDIGAVEMLGKVGEMV